MGFIEGLLRIPLAKHAHFIPLCHPYTVTTVARAFFNEIVHLRGIPSSNVSDRDLVFTSKFKSELFALARVKLCLTTTLHPQSDGQSEATNKIITMYLRRLTGHHTRQWLHGYRGLNIATIQGITSRYGRDEFMVDVRNRLLWAQQHHKFHYDKKHRPLEFTLGEWVWLHLVHPRMVSLNVQGLGKLGPKFYGPIQIVECVGDVAYKLALPPGTCVHDIFHIGLLKLFKGATPTKAGKLPPISHGRACPVPKVVTKARLARGKHELLVRSLGLPAAEATWVELEEFRCLYPDFKLADELVVRGGCHNRYSVPVSEDKRSAADAYWCGDKFNLDCDC